MAHKASNGWIAPLPAILGFTIEVFERKYVSDEVQVPTGVFVHAGGGRVYMNYAGLTSNFSFEFPNDPDFLRDVADALRKIARDTERRLAR